MTSDKSGSGEGDDLLAELDAWDKTFDALHDDESVLAAAIKPKADPDPAVRAAPVVEPIPTPVRGARLAFDDDDDDVTRTVSLPTSGAAETTIGPAPRARPHSPPSPPRSRPHTTPPPPMIEPPRPRPVAPSIAKLPPQVVAAPVAPPPGDLDETDFSDLGFSGPPSALGPLLGQPPPLPPLEGSALPSFDDDEVLTSAVRPGQVMGGAPSDASDDPFGSSEFEDETMDRGAARQRGAIDELSDPSPDPSEDTFERANQTKILDPDDELLVEAGAAKVRVPGRTPAIVRRAPVERAKRDSGGGFEGNESTRVADLRDLERLARRTDEPMREPSRATPAGSYAAPEAIGSDDDFYADIEIGGDEEEPTGTPAVAKRVTSNVVRRSTESQSGSVRMMTIPASAEIAVVPAPYDDDEPDFEMSVGEEVAVEAAPPAARPSEPVDDFGLDEAIAEFAAPELTPVGPRQAPVRSKPATMPPPPSIVVELPTIEPEAPVSEAPVSEAPAIESGSLDAIPRAVPEPELDLDAVPAGSTLEGAEPARDGGSDAAIELEASEPEGDAAIELEASEPATAAERAPSAERATATATATATARAKSESESDAALGSLFAEAAADAAVDGLIVEETVGATATAPAPAADPFGDDTSGQTRVGPPPPPRGRLSDPPPMTSAPAPAAPSQPIAIPLIAAVAPIAAPNARTLIGALAPVLSAASAPPSDPPSLAPRAEAHPTSGAGAPTLMGLSPPLQTVAQAERAAPALPAAVFADALPALDLDHVDLPERVDPTTGFDPGEVAARGLLVLEQELLLIDDPALQAPLRVEAGRLYERLGDTDHARVSYDAALLADPRATAALRGLRRLARGAGDLAEATTHLDAELGIAGPLERRALALHRVDLLMAASEQDLARVAVGELLDEAQGDVRAQLAQLELAFLDGRADELGEALERLASVVADPSLRAALSLARGHLFEREQDRARAAASYTAAIAADPSQIAGHLGAVRTVESAGAPAALRALAERSHDHPLRVALALQAARHGDAAALDEAATLDGGDATVQAAVLGDAMVRGVLSDAALALAPIASDLALRRAASLWASVRLPADDARVDGLLEAALTAEPGDDLAAATLSDRLFAAGDPSGAAQRLERRLAAGVGDELDRVRAATLWAAAGQLEPAQAFMPAADDIASPAAAEAWADILGVAGRAADRGALLASVSSRSDERVDGKLWAAKAATALDRAASQDDLPSLHRALDAWNQVAELGLDAEIAHARAMALAAGTGDGEVIGRTWQRAQAAAESVAAASTLALARARFAMAAAAPWNEVDEILREVPADDPRRLGATLVLGGVAGRWSDIALALEDRAAAIVERAPIEAALLRFRAAGVYLDRGADPARAATLLGALVDDHPSLGFVHDALGAARRRLGDAAPPPRAVRTNAGGGDDAFARLIRDAEQVAGQGDAVGALSLLAKALELRPHDPLAAEPLKRIAAGVREAGPILALALAELRLAEDSGDDRAKADAYESLARIDVDVRDDRASALISLEAAAAADPGRLVVLRELERAYGATARWSELAALRERQLASEPSPAAGVVPGSTGASDRVALALDRAMLLERMESSEDELRAAYQAIVALAPRARRALFHLETLVRRGGSSPELAALEDSIAAYFADDPRTRSAFLTRGGETLSELGRLDDAIARFREANELRGGYPAALEGWRDAALRGHRWADFADAAGKEAAFIEEPEVRAALWHLAGVALMDRAQDGERAADALRAALEADPRHTDAFIRLRLLLDEQGEHEPLAVLLEQRLEVETDTAERTALHRAIAELARNFLEDRERAKRHFRSIVETSPNDLRAIAALSDIAWEQGNWAEAADMLMARARLERDPRMLRNIHYRLGMIYAERLPDAPAAIRAFQRVLGHDPDDEEALERLADLGIATADWRMALGACERLVKNETVAARKVEHLHRVGRIFAEGFGDRRLAERAYQLAVDAAPDSDLALGALIKFYEDAGDAASIRVHLGMVAAAMRQRVAQQLEPGAFRVLARVARARHDAGVPGQGAVNRNAVDIARMCGVDASEPVPPTPIHLGGLLRAEADEVLWPQAITPELRQIFTLLGDRLAKHVGIDLRPYGVTRGDRLRAKDSPVAAAAQEVAEGFGLGEIDVFVSQRQPFAMVAEPTSPLSLVLGAAIADPNRLAAVRFAAAGALRLASAQLGILARLPEDELGVLVVALLRLFQPELPYLAIDNDQVVAQQQRLRRLIPSSLMNELRPYALGVHAASFDHRALARGLDTAAHRAGLVAAGGASAALGVLIARAGASDLATAYRTISVAELVQFAVSEDFAALAALCQG